MTVRIVVAVVGGIGGDDASDFCFSYIVARLRAAAVPLFWWLPLLLLMSSDVVALSFYWLRDQAFWCSVLRVVGFLNSSGKPNLKERW